MVVRDSRVPNRNDATLVFIRRVVKVFWAGPVGSQPTTDKLGHRLRSVVLLCFIEVEFWESIRLLLDAGKDRLGELAVVHVITQTEY